MNRRYVVFFALFASLLIVMSMPAAASHNDPVVVSSHTTASDFNNADTLDNMTVSGSGSSATVSLNDSDTSMNESFEDNDISEYGGDTAEFAVQTNTVQDGTYALNGTSNGNNNGHWISDTGTHTVDQSGNITAYLRSSTDAYLNGFTFYTQEEDGSPKGYTVLFNYGAEWIRVYETSSETQPVNGEQKAEISATISDGTWYKVTVEPNSSNGYTVSVKDGNTLLGSDSFTDSTYTSGGIGWYLRNAGTETYYFDNAQQAGGGSENGTYISANHSAENTEQGFVNITENTNATVTITWETSDGGAWSTLNQTTGITTVANHTFTWPVESNDTVRVNVTVENASGNGEPAFTFADEGVLANTSAPAVDNSSASPTGSLSTATPTLSIDVNDSDFPTAQSDQVTVKFFVDGSLEGSDTLNSNGTAQLTSSELNGGNHTWHVNAVDTYGHNQTSDTFDITVPENLTIREERPSHPKVDTVTVQFKFFEQKTDSPTIVNKTTDDGNVSLTGLPVGNEFTATINAQGYHNRTVIIEDIFTQDTAFILNKSGSTSAVDVTFTISDPTGTFTGETTEIIVQRSINQSLYASGGFEYLNIEGDEIGSAGEVRTTLEEEERYRIEVRTDSETRVLGGYTAEVSETVELRPSLPGVNVTDEEGYAWNASVNDTAAGKIVFEYYDPDDNTTDLRLRIYEQNNESNEIYDQTHAGPHGYLKVTQLLTGDQKNQTWVIDWNATRNGGTIGGERVVGRKVLEQLGQLDQTWQEAIAVLTIVLIGGLFSVRNVGAGAVTTAFVGGGFWMAGWLPDLAGGAIMLTLVAAVTWKVRQGAIS